VLNGLPVPWARNERTWNISPEKDKPVSPRQSLQLYYRTLQKNPHAMWQSLDATTTAQRERNKGKAKAHTALISWAEFAADGTLNGAKFGSGCTHVFRNSSGPTVRYGLKDGNTQYETLAVTLHVPMPFRGSRRRVHKSDSEDIYLRLAISSVG
jgi:hypothetical protein